MDSVGFHFSYICVLVFHLLGIFCARPGQREKVCYYNSFDASCPVDNVVVMEKSLYGRMDSTVCYTDGQNDDYSHCTTDTLQLTDQMCSGTRKCKVNVPDEKLDQVMPCAIKGYFEGQYSCLPGQKEEVCFYQTFDARCPQGNVVLMDHALFGRMDSTQCYDDFHDQDFSHCTTDVLFLSDQMCSGKQSCTIEIPNEEFHAAMSCSTNGYFEGSYSCIPGQTEEVCYYKSFDARCPQGNVVLMDHALFGRMDSTQCYDDFHDQDFSHCTTDVLFLSDQMCSGKQSCTIEIPNEEFHAAMSCSITGYYEGSYSCLPEIHSTLKPKHTPTLKPNFSFSCQCFLCQLGCEYLENICSTKYQIFQLQPQPTEDQSKIVKPVAYTLYCCSILTIMDMSSVLMSLYWIAFLHNSCVFSAKAGQREDVCYYKSFDARCPQGNVVLMDHASYGRMDSTTCYDDFHGQDFSHCTTDVLFHSDQMCSGKQACSIEIPNEKFHAAMSCSINGYFEASYLCLPEQREDVCYYKSFDARCPQGNMILMEHALFGRMDPTVCYAEGQNLDYSQCTTNVLSISDQMCSGIQVCSIEIPNEKFHAAMTCIMIGYFAGSYQCLPGQSEDVCYYNSFDARCSEGNVVLMNTALFGRMDSAQCYEEFQDQDFSHCTTDVLHLADQMCSGKITCQINVPNGNFDAAMPCKATKGYLEAAFTCIQDCNSFIFCVLFLRISLVFPAQAGHREDVCFYESFDARCPEGSVALMGHALFGRMDPTACYDDLHDQDFSHCTTDVLYLSDQLCSGKQSCKIDIPNRNFDGAMSCSIKGYFEGSFSCLPGQKDNVCFYESFDARCPQGNVVFMGHALFGRMDSTSCYDDFHEQDFSHCTTNVLFLSDTMCSGKQSCKIAIPNEHFDAAMSCSTKGYFEGSYTCLPGQRENVCYYKAFDARCPQGNVVLMEHALFGRMDPTACYNDLQDHDFSHCTVNVLYLSDQMCSGKPSCKISIPNESFDAAMSCSTKGYFEGSFNCLSGQREEVCFYKTFDARCPQGNVVLMDHALFGRMNPTACYDDFHDQDFSQCTTDVLYFSDQMCSGKQSCEINVPNEKFDSALSCSIRAYFEGSFSCLPVTNVNPICQANQVMRATHSEQYISSDDISKSYCARIGRRLEVQAKPGQQINITLIDFMWGSSRSGCNAYGHITDQQTGRQTTICGGQTRKNNLMLSISSTVFISTDRLDDNVRFLLKIQALGCEDLTPPNGGWMNRSHDHMTVGCLGSRDIWQMTCNQGRWTGNVGQCPHVPYEEEQVPALQKAMPLPNDIIIALIAAATFLFAVLIVTIGVIYFKRAQRRQMMLQNQQKQLFLTIKRKVMEESMEESTYMSPTLIQHEPARPHRPESAYESIHVFNRSLPAPPPSATITQPRRDEQDIYNTSQSSSSTYAHPQKYFVLDKNLCPPNTA
ncbi:hypothetical protein CAPTEDRAFT_201733 [Capitella teleta]|uniref:SUEL-type lectin domain-containing protein n=1 Tax=Capitella teleta TaxID=283909 RepID=R7U044_CAPTE|nr:hypothetical protein CAPTEDRAFT_201733 [Capitella teleta]|eukprot:ELT99578.1 hypothetical protein CAPTEDRAFT_201733 [Capitella teleta]